IKLISSVETPDDQTVLIRWREPYATAGALQSLGSSAVLGLPPLPRYLLGTSLSTSAEALLNDPYWTTGYVGLGPYRLDRWQQGSFIEASSFDRHALGAPKIQHIKIMFLPDANTALATMLSEDAQVAADQALGQAQAANLMRQWGTGKGDVVQYYNQWLAAHFQGRPDFVSPASLQ